MSELRKSDAFSLLIKSLNAGDEKTANYILNIIMVSIEQNPSAKNILLKKSDESFFRGYLIEKASKENNKRIESY